MTKQHVHDGSETFERSGRACDELGIAGYSRHSDSARRPFAGALPHGTPAPDHHIHLHERAERLEDLMRRVDAADAALSRRWRRRARAD
jgi:hypothetical protein